MISMGAFVASGGMDTLRYHAIAVDIGDLLVDEANDQTFFVDFRFRFISEQARTFFIKQYCGSSIGVSGPEATRAIYPIPKKLVSLMSDDPRSACNDVTLREGAIRPLEKRRSGQNEAEHRMTDSLLHKRVSRSLPERRRESLHEGRNGQAEEKQAYLPDSMWIARTEALSTILGAKTDAVKPITNEPGNNAETATENRDQIDGPTYFSDSNSNSTIQDSNDLSDNEFSFIGPRWKRSYSLAETKDSIELAKNHWNRNCLASEENCDDISPSLRQRGE